MDGWLNIATIPRRASGCPSQSAPARCRSCARAAPRVGRPRGRAPRRSTSTRTATWRPRWRPTAAAGATGGRPPIFPVREAGILLRLEFPQQQSIIPDSRVNTRCHSTADLACTYFLIYLVCALFRFTFFRQRDSRRSPPVRLPELDQPSRQVRRERPRHGRRRRRRRGTEHRQHGQEPPLGLQRGGPWLEARLEAGVEAGLPQGLERLPQRRSPLRYLETPLICTLVSLCPLYLSLSILVPQTRTLCGKLWF